VPKERSMLVTRARHRMASLSPHQKHLPPRLSIRGIRVACGIKIALTG
jgi:hypothetical protein